MNLSNIGSFVLQDIGDGCLTGKFFDYKASKLISECCNLKQPANPSCAFCGTYLSVWNEKPLRTIESELVITCSGNIYELDWRDTDDKVIFKGRAMLFNGFLTGFYYEQ